MKDTVENVAAALSLFYFYHYECGKELQKQQRIDILLYVCTNI